MKGIEFKVENFANIEKFKKFVNTHDCPEISVDLGEINIIDAMKFIVMSSTYHYQKYPKGKLKCYSVSEDIKDYVSSFATKNLIII